MRVLRRVALAIFGVWAVWACFFVAAAVVSLVVMAWPVKSHVALTAGVLFLIFITPYSVVLATRRLRRTAAWQRFDRVLKRVLQRLDRQAPHMSRRRRRWIAWGLVAAFLLASQYPRFM